ncbi:integrase catalytic domain-containing protein [Trichonephila clavipes]|uniref:Integrase catalytic domain-containing protein n=1 Tax=Trichonephila clavipes TaxID=2585209 RepID=A0A8X6R946_TRICX|nr:integrase catalytic domain-containing protein [Trichonephila clavipes]
MALKLNLKKDELISVAVEMEKSKQEAEKNKREAEIQLEKIKLSQIEKQLELAKVRKESEKNSQSLESGEPSSITDKLESLKRHFKSSFFKGIKSVPDELKAEILLNILGERVNKLLTYITQVTENRVHCGLIVDDDLNKTLKKFWEIECVDIEPKVDTEVSLCEDHFVRTHRRNCEGRYVVSMTLNKDPSCLGNSKDIAIRRLNSLWKRLSRDSSYLSLYAEFLKEYEELGHLERVVESSEPPTHYYILHHGVLRPEKLTTKLRIVFNGSSPTTTGISLNDILLKGEVKEDVFETISRFRRHKFAFTTNIQKMYRQILINPDQQDLQRIIWKHGLDAEILTYRLKTVTYGLSNAPFLAIRTLQQLAKDENRDFL